MLHSCIISTIQKRTTAGGDAACAAAAAGLDRSACSVSRIRNSCIQQNRHCSPFLTLNYLKSITTHFRAVRKRWTTWCAFSCWVDFRTFKRRTNWRCRVSTFQFDFDNSQFPFCCVCFCYCRRQRANFVCRNVFAKIAGYIMCNISIVPNTKTKMSHKKTV